MSGSECSASAEAIAVDDLETLLRLLEGRYPLIPHTGSSRLYSMVRRMKAEKEAGIPIQHRSGFAIEVATRKAANEMTESEWEHFYERLREELGRKYPELYESLFSQTPPTE